VTGCTSSPDFPVKNAAFPDARGSYDVFVTKLDTTQSGTNSLIYSTYFGGSNEEKGLDIAVDHTGSAHVVGWVRSMSDFPVTNQIPVMGGCRRGFLAKFSPTGTLAYSTFLAGTTSGWDTVANSVDVNAAGHSFVAGGTVDESFPTFRAYREFPEWFTCQCEGFLVQINTEIAGLPGLLYGTLFGGSFYDCISGVDVDDTGRAFVAGTTEFPTISGFPEKGHHPPMPAPNLECSFAAAFDTMYEGEDSLLYSIYVGGTHADYGRDIAVDGGGNAYVVGYTWSTNFPTFAAFQDTAGTNGCEGFVYRLENPIETSLPVPDGPGIFYIPRVARAVMSWVPADCRPVALDGLGQDKTLVTVLVPPFTNDVDAHLHLEWDGGKTNSNVHMITSNRTMIARSEQQNLVPLIAGTKGNKLLHLGELAVGQYPPGEHKLALIVTPAGAQDFSNSYRWEVDLTVPELSMPPLPDTNYVVTVTHGTNGSVTPSGNVLVPEGYNAAFHIVADPLYEILQILHDGSPMPFPDPTNVTFYLIGVTNDTSLDVQFTAQQTTKGTPYWWLAKHGWSNSFETWDLADTDMDTFPAWKEWVANTDPTKQESAFTIMEIRNEPDGSRSVIWRSSSNREYVVNWRTGVTASNDPFPDAISGDPPSNTYTDTTHSASTSGFYDVEVHIPE